MSALLDSEPSAEAYQHSVALCPFFAEGRGCRPMYIDDVGCKVLARPDVGIGIRGRVVRIGIQKPAIAAVVSPTAEVETDGLPTLLYQDESESFMVYNFGRVA